MFEYLHWHSIIDLATSLDLSYHYLLTAQCLRFFLSHFVSILGDGFKSLENWRKSIIEDKCTSTLP